MLRVDGRSRVEILLDKEYAIMLLYREKIILYRNIYTNIIENLMQSHG